MGKNDNDVNCWNCFGTNEELEKDKEKARTEKPVTLKKIREEHREKFKVYAFLASELSKPKSVPLKQKVTEHYQVGKKIENKISGELNSPILISDSVVIVDTKDVKKSQHLSESLQEKKVNIDAKTSFNFDDEIGHNLSSESIRKVSSNVSFAHSTPNNKVHFTQRKAVSLQPSIEDITSGINNLSLKQLGETQSLSFTSKDTPDMPLKKNIVKKNVTLSKVVPPQDSTKYSLGRNLNLISARKIEKSTDQPIKKTSPQTSIKNKQDNLVRANTAPEFDKVVGNQSDTVILKSPITDTSDKSLKCSTIKASSFYSNDANTLDRKKTVKSILKSPLENHQQTDLQYKHLSTEKVIFDQNTEGKTDNSSNASESGYAGSLETVTNLPASSIFKKNLKTTSLGRVNSEQISQELANYKYPVTSKLRKGLFSSVTFLPKKCRSEDELQVSETLSSNHATLPRRSNSPLPHDRDLDRERFPLNRSGLQGRSESMASVYSGAGEGLRGNVTVRGEVQFSLLYNYRLGALEVGVKRCRDLAPVDVKRNRSDPYVKVYLLPDKSKTGKRKTKVKKNTLNPMFEESLSFVQPLASLSARTVWLSVWHADMFGRNDFLGEVRLPLADVVFDDPAPMWYKLHERTEQFDEQQGSRGDLIIGLKFEVQDAARGKGTLHVLVKEAKNLVATKPNGLADVFCKSYLLPERGRLAKQKTGVVRRSLAPRWEHTFAYRGLALAELADRALELSLWDRDRLASNEFMGAVRLSLGAGTYMGANVTWMDSVGKEVYLWQTMMQSPNLWVEGSLPLRPHLIN